MFHVATTIEVQAPVELAFDVLWDVARYPEFLSDVEDVAIEDGLDATEIIAHYVVRAPRRLSYSLRMRSTAPERIEWTLMDGELQSANHGSWTVAATPDGALLTVDMHLQFRVAVPEVIFKKLVEFNLPIMMRQIRARIEQTQRGVA